MTIDWLQLKQYIKNSRKQFAKFFIIGISSLIIDMLLLILLKEKIKLAPVYAVAINQLFVIAYNFLMNKYWSFNSRKQGLKQLTRYAALVCFNYLASIIFMYVFSDVLNIDYRLVRLGTIALLFIFNFIVYKTWVYKET